MGNKNVYERFIWLDHRVRECQYPNATGLAEQFEVSVKTAQRDIEFMRDRLNCPLTYDQNYSQSISTISCTFLNSGSPVTMEAFSFMAVATAKQSA